MFHILHNNRGETMIEALASILIGTFSVALLFTCIMSSFRIDDSVRAVDEERYKNFSEADARVWIAADPADPDVIGPSSVTSIGSIEITVQKINPDTDSVLGTEKPTVSIYGGNGIYSYKK